MKKVLVILFFLLYSHLLFAKINLYTADKTEPFELQSMTDILERFVRESPEKNILFYVHGRNNDVDHEWNKIKVMEETYHVRTVMLHWDAWSGLLSRAVKNAELTALPLSNAFKQIEDFKLQHPEKKISLLCHSMGNLVLKNFIERYQDTEFDHTEEPLFENYISVGADVPMKDHSEWLSRFHLARSKYITMNDHDIVLLLSYSLDVKDKDFLHYKLGLGLDNPAGRKDQIKRKLASDVTYIDFSGVLKTEHSYNLPKTPLLKNIFNKLTNSESFSLSEEEIDLFDVKISREKNILYLKNK